MAAQFVLLILSFICTFIEALPRGRGGSGRSGAAAGGGAGKLFSQGIKSALPEAFL